MVDWQHALEQKWATLRFGEVKVETDGGQHVFEVQVYLNDLDPKAVRVELYADGVNGGEPVRQEMKRVRQLAGAERLRLQRGCVRGPPGSGLYGARDTALRRRCGPLEVDPSSGSGESTSNGRRRQKTIDKSQKN